MDGTGAGWNSFLMHNFIKINYDNTKVYIRRRLFGQTQYTCAYIRVEDGYTKSNLS